MSLSGIQHKKEPLLQNGFVKDPSLKYAAFYTYAVTCLKCPCYKNMLGFIYQHIL